jgi:ribosomal protein S18 acetylase RimI-like enzyme
MGVNPNEGVKTVIRRLTPADLERVVLLDAKVTGRRRDGYFEAKLKENMAKAGIQVSLAAETGGVFSGFLLAKVWYGEFGTTEPVAVLDTIGAHPDFRGRGIGAALFEQLRTNLRGLGIARIRTEVSWDAQSLMAFLHHERFRPAPRICLEADVEDPVLIERAARRAEAEEASERAMSG